MSNILDPDQARHFVGLDLGPNCLRRLSADDIRRQRVKEANISKRNRCMAKIHPFIEQIHIQKKLEKY